MELNILNGVSTILSMQVMNFYYRRSISFYLLDDCCFLIIYQTKAAVLCLEQKKFWILPTDIE